MTKFEENHPIIHVTIDGGELVVDEQTGEIIDGPDGRIPRMEDLIQMAVEAADAVRKWELKEKAAKSAIRFLLKSVGIKKAVGGAGTATLVKYDAKRVPGGERMEQWLRDVEFPPSGYPALISVSTGFNAEGFESVCDDLAIDPDAIVNRSEVEYIRVTVPPPPASHAYRE